MCIYIYICVFCCFWVFALLLWRGDLEVSIYVYMYMGFYAFGVFWVVTSRYLNAYVHICVCFMFWSVWEEWPRGVYVCVYMYRCICFYCFWFLEWWHRCSYIYIYIYIYIYTYRLMCSYCLFWGVVTSMYTYTNIHRFMCFTAWSVLGVVTSMHLYVYLYICVYMYVFTVWFLVSVWEWRPRCIYIYI